MEGSFKVKVPHQIIGYERKATSQDTYIMLNISAYPTPPKLSPSMVI